MPSPRWRVSNWSVVSAIQRSELVSAGSPVCTYCEPSINRSSRARRSARHFGSSRAASAHSAAADARLTAAHSRNVRPGATHRDSHGRGVRRLGSGGVVASIALDVVGLHHVPGELEIDGRSRTEHLDPDHVAIVVQAQRFRDAGGIAAQQCVRPHDDRRRERRIESDAIDRDSIVAEDPTARDVQAAEPRMFRVIVDVRLRVIKRRAVIGERDGAIGSPRYRHRETLERRGGSSGQGRRQRGPAAGGRARGRADRSQRRCGDQQ